MEDNKRQLANDLTRTALMQLKTSTDYKRGRFSRVSDAIDLMLGKVKPKVRQQFNVPLPVLNGMFETLCADLDDPVSIKVKNNSGKNLKAVHGINDTITIAKKSLKNTARWDYKDRISRKNAIAYGRGILKYYSIADPYTNILEVVNPKMFHCQPRGGGILERHLFCGEEGIIKTKKQLLQGAEEGVYDKKGVEMIIDRAQDKDYQEKMNLQNEDNIRHFRALGLDPDANNFVGETTFNLCEWVLTRGGERYYLLFDPWTKTWIRFEKLIDINGSGYYPWVSYATHEDDENFWSTSILADILYPIADSIITLFNQELTNRQKRNLNAKLYDKDMIKNVAKLDEAQYRPDALVPVDTLGGVRRLDQATYSFQTPELTGSVELINWLDEFTGKQLGVMQQMPAVGKKTNNIVYAQIQQLAKRVDYRSHSYTEAWGEITLRHIQGLKDNISEDEAFNLLGPENGFEFKKNLKQIKLDKDDIEIISTKQQAQEDALRKAQKEKALTMVIQDPTVNPEWKTRQILTDIGGWEQDEVEDALDLRGKGVERDQLGAAEEAIKDLIKGKEPEVCWSATTIYQRKIMDFAVGHRVSLGERYPKFMEWILKHTPIVAENMAQLALRMRAYQPPAQPGQEQGGQPGAPGGQPAPGGPQTVQGGGAGSMQAGMPTPAMVNQQ